MSVAIVANLDCNVARSDGQECLHKIRNRPANLLSNWRSLTEPKTRDGNSDMIGLINIACFAVLSNGFRFGRKSASQSPQGSVFGLIVG